MLIMYYLLQVVTCLLFVCSRSEGGMAKLTNVTVSTPFLSCQDPGTPKYASREDNLKSFLPGMEVIFTCQFTYRIIGSPVRTCLANGSWSGVQPICEKYMCDELDAPPPKYGKRMGNDFTFGGVVTFKCIPKRDLMGEAKLTCLSNGEWSAKAPICQDRCAKFKCGRGQRCKLNGRSPVCECRDNMDCPSNLDTVCGSDGTSYTNECIMNATACRTYDIRKIKSGRCIPGGICSIVPVSNCRASFNVFYYNVSEKRCKSIIAGGCHPSGWNGFWTKAECKNTCMADVCHLKPETGPCDKNKDRFYYDAATDSCKIFKYGGCFGNANNFPARKDCLERCT